MASIGADLGLSAATSAVDLGFNTAQYAINSAINHKYWQKQYDITRSDFLADREHQESYSSPENQMKLLAEAGLNPNLVYGKFQGAGAVGSSSQAQQQPSSKGSTPFGTTDVAMKMAAMAQRDQALANIDSIEAAAELQRAQAENIRLQSQWYGTHMQSVIDTNKATIEKLYADAKLSADQSQLILVEGALKEAQEEYVRGQIGLQEYLRQNIIAQSGLFSSQSRYYDDAAKLNQIDYELKAFNRDLQNAIREADGIDKMSKIHLDSLQERFNILKATASVEGSKVMQWIEHIAPVLVDLSTAGKNTSDAVLSWSKRNSSEERKDNVTSELLTTMDEDIDTGDMIKLLKILASIAD